MQVRSARQRRMEGKAVKVISIFYGGPGPRNVPHQYTHAQQF